jgi:membrane-associated protease RseP (regulator of RpoE activity)
MKAVALLLALACLATVSGAADKAPPPPKDKVLVLDPIRIIEAPIISYAIDIAVYADPKTRLTTNILITRVLPDTDAERAGLQKGDEIVKIDGEPVKGMDSRVGADTQLGRLLLNRTPGDPLKLEIIVRRPQEFTLRANRGIPTMKLK